MTDKTPLPEVVANLRGATVTVWTYSVSHQTLTLRFQLPTQGGNTHLICSGCSRLEVSPHWLDSNFEVSNLDGERIQLIDRNALARIECRLVHVQLDVPPVF